MGTSTQKSKKKAKALDHPHACGDKQVRFAGETLSAGSSPRVWGQGDMFCISPRWYRIIPTRVGTRPVFYQFAIRSEDHPHACGDKYRLQLLCRQALRIIPTRVGTSFCCWILNSDYRDHPHACGDKNGARIMFQIKKGSSPRVWGQVASSDIEAVAGGIIPTRVGTSKKSYRRQKGYEDHPHACGDKLMQKTARCFLLGSSPRVWGQDRGFHLQREACRIIPTRVGTSNLPIAKLSSSEDHPHACGDKLRILLTRERGVGSSPRVWGQGKINNGYKDKRGIIPTRVGTSVVVIDLFFL